MTLKCILWLSEVLLDGTMSFVIDRSKSKSGGGGASVSKELPYITEVQWNISDLPFARS